MKVPTTTLLWIIAVCLWIMAGCTMMHVQDKPVHKHWPQMIG